jgi:hypothetical protein
MSGNERAFPSFDRVGDVVCSPEQGLSKREYFAAQIAAGIAANYDQEAQNAAWNFEAIALRAVRTADALIAELAK